MIGSDGESHRGEVHTPQVRASTKNTRYDPEIPEIPEIKLKALVPSIGIGSSGRRVVGFVA
jgi:hypothetical protein